MHFFFVFVFQHWPTQMNVFSLLHKAYITIILNENVMAGSHSLFNKWSLARAGNALTILKYSFKTLLNQKNWTYGETNLWHFNLIVTENTILTADLLRNLEQEKILPLYKSTGNFLLSLEKQYTHSSNKH